MSTITRIFTVRGTGFGPDLTTVGYTLKPGGERTADGVTQIGPTGGYQATVTYPSLFSGLIYWDNGLEGEDYRDAWEEIVPASSGGGGTIPVPTDPGDVLATVRAALAAGVAGPKRVSGDAGSVEAHALGDLIEAVRYLTRQEAMAKAKGAIMITKLIPPGNAE